MPRRSWLPVTSPILRCLSRAWIRASSRRRGFSSSAPTPARFARSDGSSRRTSARRRKRSRPDRSRLDRWAGPAGPVHRRRPDRDRPPLPGLACRRADALPLARRRSAAAYDPHVGGSRALGSAAGSGAHHIAASCFRRMGVSLCVLARPRSRAAAPSWSAQGRLLVRARCLVPLRRRGCWSAPDWTRGRDQRRRRRRGGDRIRCRGLAGARRRPGRPGISGAVRSRDPPVRGRWRSRTPLAPTRAAA